MAIDLRVFELYLKNGSELLWIDDPARFPRPPGTSLQTDEMFVTISRTEDILAQLASGYYSDELSNELVAEILNLEQQMTEDVFDELLSIHGLTKETLYNRR